MNLFITLLENVNKSRTSANNVSLSNQRLSSVLFCNRGSAIAVICKQRVNTSESLGISYNYKLLSDLVANDDVIPGHAPVGCCVIPLLGGVQVFLLPGRFVQPQGPPAVLVRHVERPE
jgi:hypothetical protein